MKRKTTIATLVAVLGLASPAIAAEVKPQTVVAFDHYIQSAERQMDSELQSGRFLVIDALALAERAQVETRLRRGEILIQRLGTENDAKVPGGLVHHWVAIGFIPGSTLAETLTVVQDYDHLERNYQPEVTSLRLISRDGDHFVIFMRLRRKKVATVILDTEYDVHFFRADATRAYSRSHSIRVAEVENPGRRDERERPVGNDHGFMWRLNSYWRFREADGGVYVQCEAISLTRDIPPGLGWLVGPLVRSIPQDSLRFTLNATRDAVIKTPMAQPHKISRQSQQ